MPLHTWPVGPPFGRYINLIRRKLQAEGRSAA
jgi:hypothetical protein